MKRLLTILVVAVSFLLPASAANTKTTVSQVTESITLTDDVDYIVNTDTPFDGDGLVNIENTDHAVLILERIKPSVAIASILPTRVKINGAVARNNVNCQVRLYGSHGCIILPYSFSDKPLTVYSEQNFEGEQCSDFGLENDGGYMVTLTAEKLNNRIHSFRLKRGYMVTFATQKSGYGYQRCFIANNADLEMATLPQLLDGKISSYRVFKWNTAGKAGLASSTNADALKALGVISCYGWDEGYDVGPDAECVVHHLYEDYPSSAKCGEATWTCHMKTNNEPRNSADDKPQTLATILGNWQNLMRTGMRLCSPSSWDGSDNTDGTGFIKTFLDSIDARGWRCDIVDLHCYWTTDLFDKIGTMQSKYKRPIWISEWIWGASWNKNGIFESGKTKWDNEWAVKTICTKFNSWGYIERYFYWNSEGSAASKLYVNDELTPAGEWYSKQLTGMGYNANYAKVPNTPPMRGGFRDFRVTADGGTATITWHDYDGEYDQLMEVLRKEPGGGWETWQIVAPEDTEADYTLTDNAYTEGTRYRLHIRSFSGRDYYSSEDLEAGEAVVTDAGTRYVGGNIIANGNFEMGLYGWTNGQGNPLSQPWFEVFPKQLTDGYFLQAFANQGKDNVGSLKTAFDIEPGQDYLFQVAGQNFGDYVKVDVRTKGNTTDENRLTMKNSTYWTARQGIFNSGNNNEALLSFRWLAATGQISNIELHRLFDTREEAIADGVAQARHRAQTFTEYNTALPALNAELLQILSDQTTVQGDLQSPLNDQLNAIEQATNAALTALRQKALIDSLLTVAAAIDDMLFEGREDLLAAEQQAAAAVTGDLQSVAGDLQSPAAGISAALARLQQALDTFMPMAEAAQQPLSPAFEDETNWLTKVGTYTGGDQRTATQQDLTCWNAWWDGLSSSEGTAKTMTVTQEVTGLTEGLYSLECKGSTQHYCLSDQHGFITTLDSQLTAVTPCLTRDYLDIPNTPSAWQTLTTTPLYVPEGGSLTIGFTSSKEGATDYAWRRYGNSDTSNNKGDRREGWWCATDFRLLYHPLFKKAPTPSGWTTICLPYAFQVPEGVTLYRIAGLSSDYSLVCLEEVTETEPGHPYIVSTSLPQATFYTSGETAMMPSRDEGNLRGYFKYIGWASTGTYQLFDDGEWHRIASSEEHYKPGNYCAYILKAEGMPLFDTWDGPTMVIHGVEEELGTPALLGDVNGDGTVDVADIAAIIDVMAGVSFNPNANPEADNNHKADVNGDGSVDVADIAMVIDIMAGI